MDSLNIKKKKDRFFLREREDGLGRDITRITQKQVKGMIQHMQHTPVSITHTRKGRGQDGSVS